MTTALWILGSFVIGFYIGRRIGILQTMIRVQKIFDDLQRIQHFFSDKKIWNEDQL